MATQFSIVVPLALKRAAVLLTAVVLPASANAAELRVRTQAGYQTNQIEFRRVEYVGQCPGIILSSGTLRGQFVSETVPPASGRRVIIRNVTEGMKSDPYPYSDREYSEGQYSEGFEFGIDDRHRTQTFSVLEGENKFEYEIREKDRVIEQGSFTAGVIVKDVGVFPRDTICSNQLECRDESVDCGTNKDGSRRRGKRERCYTTTNCRCPN